MARAALPSHELASTDDDGMVTVEAVFVMPVLMLVLALLIATLSVVHAQMQVVDASRAAARAAARGDSDAEARAAGARLGPRGSTVRLVTRSHWVQAVVTARVPLVGPLPAVRLKASTLAEREEP